jgi:hypothetical protein
MPLAEGPRQAGQLAVAGDGAHRISAATSDPHREAALRQSDFMGGE